MNIEMQNQLNFLKQIVGENLGQLFHLARIIKFSSIMKFSNLYFVKVLHVQKSKLPTSISINRFRTQKICKSPLKFQNTNYPRHDSKFLTYPSNKNMKLSIKRKRKQKRQLYLTIVWAWCWESEVAANSISCGDNRSNEMSSSSRIRCQIGSMWAADWMGT